MSGAGGRSLPRRATLRGLHLSCARAAALACLALGGMLAGPPAEADEDPFAYGELGRSEIVAQLFGQTIEGNYPNGRAFTESLNADLTTRYVDDRNASRGLMTFDEDRICFEYADEPEMNGGCFIVWQRSANCYDFYATLDGIAFADFLSRSLGLDWDARVWRQGAGSTCPTVPVS